MQISEIQILPVKPRDGLIAFVSCVLNDQFFIGNIAVYTSPSNAEGYRLVYPSKILPNGKSISCIHPINRVTGDEIQKVVIKKYEEFIEKVTKGNASGYKREG